MASIQISSSLDMHSFSTWYGNISSYDATHITVTNGPLQGIYTGTFGYDAYGNVYGTLTGFTETFSGLPAFSISGMNVSATYAEQLIASNQIQTLFQTALSGDDQFTVTSGTHVIDGYGGYNTVTESQAHTAYSISTAGSAVLVTNAAEHDTLYNIQRINFTDGFYNTQTQTFSPNAPSGGGFAATDVTTGKAVATSPQSYSGPVAGLQNEFISVTPDNLNVSVSTPNWFIHTGSGQDAIAVSSGVNVLDGGTGSNFLTGGSGTDTFFVDDRGATADI
ncbi:MAG: hypothetical protein JO227_08165, partial [Acetobacteraceae bacterium]|nr:hypothetical protein [Acetobacteraceae bacterium]